jgi:hypothetical protein
MVTAFSGPVSHDLTFSQCTLLQQSLFIADISWAAVKDVPLNEYGPFAGPNFKAAGPHNVP